MSVGNVAYGYINFWKERYIFTEYRFLQQPDDKVCIVSIIGKQRLSNHATKITRLNSIIGNDVFEEKSDVGNLDCEIEGYYDVERRVIYLHLQSVYDAASLASICQRACSDLSKGDSADVLQRAEHRYAKCLLFLFNVSHLITIVHPGNSFDISYVRFFRVLDQIRLKLQNSVCEHLKTLRAGKDWYLAGRPCSPRVLFIFDSCTLNAQDLASDQVVMSKTRSQKTPPIKRLQHAIEDQIYRILRKSRVITNISNNSLFAVPANQEFVYICPKREDTKTDLISYYLDQLKSNCSTVRDGDTPRSKSYQVNRRGNQPSARESASRQSTSHVAQEGSLEEFLSQHIDLALSKGFDDNVGRNPVPAVFYLPTAEIWLRTADRLYGMFMLDQDDTRAAARPHFNTLHSLLDINHRFSEGRCAKVLPMAETAYQEGLPQHYTKTYHVKKLQQAKRVFLQHARGPACDKYLKQLEESCEKLWQKGRQLCEEISITGHHCINQLHRLPEEKETNENEHLPVMPHVSQHKTRGTCNCGNKQMDRDDPFDHKGANYDFFQKLASQCCVEFETFELPVFKASVPEAKVHAAGTVAVKPSSSGDSESPILGRREVTSEGRPLSLALSLGHSAGSDVFPQHEDSSFNPDASQNNALVAIAEEADTAAATAASEREVLRQLSTTEYLPGMLHSEAPPQLLPRFPSWSLMCMGKPSLYIPSQGVEQPNFSHQCNFLLPWDVTVKADQERWPPVHEAQQGKKQKQFRRASMSVDYTVRIYIGFEYECPRGHRFLLSGPDKIFKAPPTGIFKETAHKVLGSSMPMYFPCNCRSSKGYMGQIMRLHAVVPEGPVVELHARLKPAPDPCPFFFPGYEDPIVLPHEGWWILRFPYVYLGEKGPYLMPKEASKVIQCHLQKNILRVINET